ncbi:hypothetical protein [Microcoleus sp. CAWBG58]|nr:hypothetical protein [Microcoleus sp. CAWBG58]
MEVTSVLANKFFNLSEKKRSLIKRAIAFFYIKLGRNPFPISTHELTS